MTSADIGAALVSLRPGAQWSLSGNTLASLVWLDQVQTAPTQAEVDAEISRLASVASTEAVRVASYQSDAGRIDLLTRLHTATPAQIDTFVENNVTTLAAARAMFKLILKAIALDSRQ